VISSRRSGALMIELGIYLGVFVVLVGPLSYAILQSTRTHEENDTMTKLSERCRVVLFRMAGDVRACQGDTLTIINNQASLRFTEADAFDGTAIVDGSEIQYDFVTQNGAGLLRRSDLTSGDSSTLCEWVDVANSSFQQNGDAITITLALTAGDRTVFDLTRSLTVMPRN